MIQRQVLLELTESYLESVVAEAGGARGGNLNSTASFGELRLDSFRVLKAIKALEADFGTLPKTLLFEHCNISDLAGYFVENHGQTLHAKFAAQLQGGPVTGRPAGRKETLLATTAATPVTTQPRPHQGPLPMLERDAYAQVQTATPVTIVAGESRSGILAEFDFNPLNVPQQHIEFDLKTDSWAQLQLPAIQNRTRHLHAQLQQPADLEENLRQIFPFAHFVLTTSGRSAESVFYRAWPRRGLVPQNLLFPTTLLHQIDKGFTPLEVPHPQVFKLDSLDPHKGNLDFSALQEQIVRDPGAIAMVCIELSNNASGGCPVSIEHLGQVKALLAENSIPLVMDATRILENARFLIEAGGPHAGRTLWEIARLIGSHADVVMVSLAKEFCVKGGVIATNDAQLFHRLQMAIVAEGCGLNVVDKKLVALGLGNRSYIEAQVLRRKESVGRLWGALHEHGIPVARPVGGHCVLIDVKQIPELSAFKYPVASFLAWLYINTGIRAGAHNPGLQQGTALNDLVRLPVPVGLKSQQIDDIIDRLIALFATKKNIPEVARAAGDREPIGDIHARYALIKYHNVSGPMPDIGQLSRTATLSEECSNGTGESNGFGDSDGRGENQTPDEDPQVPVDRLEHSHFPVRAGGGRAPRVAECSAQHRSNCHAVHP